MSEQSKQENFAVLIDGDNAQASLLPQILAEVTKAGLITIKRIYGDWTTTNMNSWKEICWHGRGGQGAVTAAKLLVEGAQAKVTMPKLFPNSGMKEPEPAKRTPTARGRAIARAKDKSSMRYTSSLSVNCGR